MTHILSGTNFLTRREALDDAKIDLDAVPAHVPVLRVDWLQQCLKQKKLLSTSGYSLLDSTLSVPDLASRTGVSNAAAEEQETKEVPFCAAEYRSASCVLRTVSGETVEVSGKDVERGYLEDQRTVACSYHCYNCGSTTHGAQACTKALRGTDGNMYEPSNSALKGLPYRVRAKFLCAKTHAIDKAKHPNQHIIDAFEDMRELLYEPRADKEGQMKAMQTGRTITMLRGIKTPITSTDGLDKLPFIGKRAIEKIDEIIEYGHLKRVVNADTPENKALRCFSKIHGIGPRTAKRLVDEGYRTIEQLRETKVLVFVFLSYLVCVSHSVLVS